MLFVLICISLFGFITDKPFIVVHGEKYYRCSQYTKTYRDTTYSGYGAMWIEQTTTTVQTMMP